MAFLVNCYVRKISQELMDKLNQLGYEDAWNGYIHTEELKTITFACTNKKGEALWSLTGFPPEEYIDCGDNERLFLALAALRDDTDINSWFKDLDTNKLFICTKNSIYDMATEEDIDKYGDWIGIGMNKYQPATVEEIVKHFKDK